MAEFNHYEYVVTDKGNKSRKWQKPLMILGYIVVDVALFFALYRINPFLISLEALSTWMMVYFTWRYLNVEYEYSIESGEFSYTKIYGNRTRKQQFSVKTKDLRRIIPFEDKYMAELEKEVVDVTFVGVPNLELPNLFVAFFETSDNKRAAFYFQADSNSLKSLKFYNSSAFPRDFQIPKTITSSEV